MKEIPANFREHNDAALAKLDDEKIIEYIRSARKAGKKDAIEMATQVLAFKYQEKVLGYVRARMERFGSAIYEEVAEVALSDAVVASVRFRGEVLPEFGGLVFRIAFLRIQDYHRKKRIDTEPLTFIDKDGEVRTKEAPVPDKTEQIAELSVRVPVFKKCFAELNPVHQEVIRLVRYQGLSHKAVAEEINRQFSGDSDDPMTDQNVAKIDSRFGKSLKRALDDAEGTSDNG